MAVPVLCPMLGCLDLGLPNIPPALLPIGATSHRRPRYRKPDILLSRGTQVGTSEAAIRNAKRWGPSLLSLPLEIRLQIYDWVYRTSPVKKKALDTGYPVPTRQAQITKPVEEECADSDCSPRLLRQDRPYNYIPSNLLRLNRQVYMEAREIPFHGNEFVFENWFSSGLAAASTLVKDVFEPWQTRAMRFVRIEARERDLDRSGSLDTWRELSKEWSDGLHGLRVSIHVSKGGWSEENRLADFLHAQGPRWVVDGCLTAMKGLKRLEIELVTPPPLYSDENKLVWCRDLQRVLANGGSNAVVVCVEREAQK